MRVAAVPLALLLVACGGGAAPDDAGTDGGARDAAGGDAGGDLGTDAGPRDFGVDAPCADADGDGHTAASCGGDDCDDTDPHRHPGATEVCDVMNVDEDCDPTTFGHTDADGDGYVSSSCCNHDAATGVDHCGTDCNDMAPGVHPTVPEVCNGVDDDCNGVIDDGVPVGTYREDCDGDGYAALTGTTVDGCRAPSMAPPDCGGAAAATWTTMPGDCDDAHGYTHPTAMERCDGQDNDCDGIGEDLDGDGHIATTDTCNRTLGTFLPLDDCYDQNADVVPGQMRYFSTPICPTGQVGCRYLVVGSMGMSSIHEDCIAPTDTCPTGPMTSTIASLGPAHGWDYDCNGTESFPGPTSVTCSALPTCATPCLGGGWSYVTMPGCGVTEDQLVCGPRSGCTCGPATAMPAPLPCR